MHKVELSRVAEASYRLLHKRDRRLFERVDAALDGLAREPLEGKPLKGALSGLRSLRVGSYRTVYRVEQRRLIVYFLDIGDRREAYR